MRPLLWDIYEEHLAEAAFLWTQWERALDSPLYSLADVAEGPEERLLAHLDGLVLGGPEVAERLLLPVLEDDGSEPDVLWAAAYAALEGQFPGGEDLVIKALSFEAPELRAAAARALELSSHPGLEAKLRPLLPGGGPVAVAALRALAARGADVRSAVDRLIESGEPEVAAAALRQVGPTPPPFVREVLERSLRSGEPLVRDAAREAGVLARLSLAWEACLEAVRAGEGSRVALQAVAAGGSDAEVADLVALLEQEPLRAAALVALGYSGRAAAAEACLAWMGDKAVGALAAEAFMAITGAPVKPLLAEPEEEEDEAEGQEEDPGEEVITGPEVDLPLLDPDLAAGWWKKQRSRFKPGVRTLAGAPWSAAAVSAALREGPARRRHALAVELAVRTQQAPADTRRWARAQRASPPSTARFDERAFGELCR